MRSGSLVLTQRIAFSWYDKEESGLLGSRAAVALLINGTVVGERLQDVVAQLNADMIGSPNAIMGTLDCSLTGLPGSRAGSAVLTSMFQAEFVARGWPFRNFNSSRYTQGSDQYSYLAQGIPAAILFSGVTEIHTAEDARDFSGVIGMAADPCYHQASAAAHSLLPPCASPRTPSTFRR